MIKRGLLFPVLIAIAILFTFSGCDSTAKFYPYNIQFDKLQFVSAYPAVKNNEGVYEPVCSGTATGVLFNINMVSTQLSDNKDKDLSIRPGDSIKGFQLEQRFIVKEGENIGPDIFQINIECVEPYPDPDLLGLRECQGLLNPGGTGISYFRYFSDIPPDAGGGYRRLVDEENKFGLALLVDQSGSMKGRVHKETYKEVAPGDSNETNEKLEDYASDITNYRLSAIKDLINDLNKNDKLIMFAYGEIYGPSPKTVCNLPDDPNADEQKKRDSCFGVNRSLILGDPATGLKSALDPIQYDARGRAPLYQALYEVWEYMKKQTVEYKYIVVVNDGPDTCHRESENYIEPTGAGPCSTVGYKELKEKILSNPDVNIKINFIQFQSKGYREIDATQQELACLTGGHYIFINSEDFAKTGQALYDALKESVMKVRYTLAGVWRMAVEFPGFADNKLGPGKIYSIKGTITLNPSEFTPLAKTTYLAIGEPDAGKGNWDKRGLLRKSCGGDGECSMPAEVCKVDACLADSLVCGKKNAENGSACPDGICCSGVCEVLAECPK